MTSAAGRPLGPPRLQVGCFVVDGLLQCLTTVVSGESEPDDRPASKPGKSRGKGADPSRSPEALKKTAPSSRDEQSESALAARMTRRREDDVRLTKGAQASLGYPEPPRLGALIQGSDRPSPDRGMQWQDGVSDQPLSSRNAGLEASSAPSPKKKLAAPPRVGPPVPTVASLMYSN